MNKPKTLEDLKRLHEKAGQALWDIELAYKLKTDTLNTGIKLKDIFDKSEDATNYFLDVYSGHDKDLAKHKKTYEDCMSELNSINKEKIKINE